MRFLDMRHFSFPMRKRRKDDARLPERGDLFRGRANVARTAFAISSNKYVYRAARLARNARTPSRHNHGGE